MPACGPGFGRLEPVNGRSGLSGKLWNVNVDGAGKESIRIFGATASGCSLAAPRGGIRDETASTPAANTADIASS